MYPSQGLRPKGAYRLHNHISAKEYFPRRAQRRFSKDAILSFGFMKYYRLMLGKGSRYAEQCVTKNFIGAGFGIERDYLVSSRQLASVQHRVYPCISRGPSRKNKITTDLTCGML